MERRIGGIINLNVWLTIFLLINAAIKTSINSDVILGERILVIVICIFGGFIINKKVSKYFFTNGFKNIYKITIILSFWWLIISLVLPTINNYTSLSMVFCLLFTFCLYQGFFYRKIDHEKIPFYSLLLPLILIILSFIFLICMKDYSRAIVSLFVLVSLYMSFRLKKIVMWRNIFIFTVIISVITILIYLYNNKDLLINIEPNFQIDPYFNLFGKGLGNSNLVNDPNFTYQDLLIVRLFMDEVGLFALICVNFTSFYLIYFLYRINKIVVNSKETYRLLVKGFFLFFTLELIMFNLGVLGLLPFSNINHPLLASSLDYLWWNLGISLVRGLILRTETIGQMSQTSIQGII